MPWCGRRDSRVETEASAGSNARSSVTAEPHRKGYRNCFDGLMSKAPLTRMAIVPLVYEKRYGTKVPLTTNVIG